MRRRNQKIGIVSYSSRKEEETLINKKRSSSNHKWEGRASGKREQGDHSFCQICNIITASESQPNREGTGLDLLNALAIYFD